MLVIPSILHSLHTAGSWSDRSGSQFFVAADTYNRMGSMRHEKSGGGGGVGRWSSFTADCGKFKVIIQFATSLAALPTRNITRPRL